MLRYVAQARDRGLGVVLITHNPHHAYPVGDRFLLLNRGRSLGSFAKADVTPRGADPADGRRRRSSTSSPTSWSGRTCLTPGVGPRTAGPERRSRERHVSR